MFEPDVRRIDYERYTNRQLAAVPLVVLALALIVIGGWWAVTGSPANLGIELSGGTELRLETTASGAEVVEAFDAEVESIRPVVDEDQYIVTFRSSDLDAIRGQATDEGFTIRGSYTTGPTFAAGNQTLTVFGVGIAFVGMSVLVFLLFRSFVPSIAIVVSAFSDIVIPIAVMNLLGIRLSLGTVAALLMLIGYSVDSDILLNNHILRRSGEFYDSAYRAMRTGVTMTLTSLSAVIVMAIVASIFGISLLASIGLVLAIGLAADLMNTYLLNLSLLRWYRGVEV